MGVELTLRLTGRVLDVSLDSRQMLSVSDDALEAAYSKESLGCLAAAIVLKCTNFTSLSVKIGTDRNRGQYYEDDDDEEHTMDAQWKVIKHIINLVIKVIRRTEALKTLDISFDLHNISPFLPRIVLGSASTARPTSQ